MLTTPVGAVVTDMSCAYCLEKMSSLLTAHIYLSRGFVSSLKRQQLFDPILPAQGRPPSYYSTRDNFRYEGGMILHPIKFAPTIQDTDLID